MSSLETAIRTRLEALQPERIELEDESALHAGHAGAQGGGKHYRLTIVSPRFAGKSKLARHRLVYEALGSLMDRDIHALAIQAHAPGESRTGA